MSVARSRETLACNRRNALLVRMAFRALVALGVLVTSYPSPRRMEWSKSSTPQHRLMLGNRNLHGPLQRDRVSQS